MFTWLGFLYGRCLRNSCELWVVWYDTFLRFPPSDMCNVSLMPQAVIPSVQSVRLLVRTGRTAVTERAPATDGYLRARPDDSPGRAGTAGVSGGAIFPVTPDDGRAL